MQSAGTRKEVEQVSRKQEVTNGHYLLAALRLYTGKNQNFRKFRSTRLKPRLNPKIKRKNVTKMNIDDGEFQQQSTQRLVDRYEYMDSRNERLMVRLKAIEAEYYSIEN